MKLKLCLCLAMAVAILAPAADATSYYVDCVNGLDKSDNPGTSPGSPWKTLGRVNGFVPGHVYSGNATLTDTGFNPGDTVYLKRGCSWDWHLLISPNSGTTGNFNGTNVSGPPFSIDAYGNGAPATIQAEISAPLAWALLAGTTHVYYATVHSVSQGTGWYPSNITSVKFGATWGICKGQQGVSTAYCTGTAGTGSLANNRDWYYSNALGGCLSNSQTQGTGVLYVYDNIGSNPSSDFGAITVALDGYGQLVSVNRVSNVSIQHLKLLNHSWYGIEVSGASDNVAIANVYADTEVPFNYHGVGFYIHPTASGSISLLNTEAHRGYYGYQFCQSAQPGCVTAATVINCKAYFSRAAPLLDLTGSAVVGGVTVAAPGTAVSYDYCHFYGNGIGSPTDLQPSGGTPGTHNIAPLSDPQVVSWLNYNPRMVLNFQKPGAEFGDDTALNSQLSALGSAPLSIGIATNYTYSTSLISQFQTWINAGYDLNSLGLSASSYANNQALNIQYTGTGTAAALTINGPPATTFSIAVSGAPIDNFTFPITSTTTIAQLKAALLATGKYSAVWPQPCGACSWIGGSAMLAQDLQAESAVSIPIISGTMPYSVDLSPAQFLTDEASRSKTWMLANLTFPGSHQWIYEYPGELYDPFDALIKLTPAVNWIRSLRRQAIRVRAALSVCSWVRMDCRERLTR